MKRRVRSDNPPPWFLLPEKPSEGLLTSEEWVILGTTFNLTARELDAAILIFEDGTRMSIGRRLKRSPAAIRKRIDKVFKKLNVKDRLGLVQRLWQVYRTLYPEREGHKDAP